MTIWRFDGRRTLLTVVTVIVVLCAAGCGSRKAQTPPAGAADTGSAVVNDLRSLGTAAHDGLPTDEQPPEQLYRLVAAAGHLSRSQAAASLRAHLPALSRAELRYYSASARKVDAVRVSSAGGKSGRRLE